MLYSTALTIGLFLLSFYFFSDSTVQTLFWFSLVLSTASVGLVLASNASAKWKLVALLLFVAAIHIAPLIRGYGGGINERLIYSRDEPYQIQLDQLVIEAKHRAPGMGLGEATAYSNYPMLPILAVTAFQLLGLQSGASFFSSILFPALTAILPMFWYVRSAEAITGSSDWALWSGYVFGLNEQFLFFDASFSYESLGIVFFTATMYLLTRRRKGAILSSLMIIGLTLTHFWTNINLVLFLAASYLLPRLGTSLKLRLNALDAQLLRPTGGTSGFFCNGLRSLHLFHCSVATQTLWPRIHIRNIGSLHSDI